MSQLAVKWSDTERALSRSRSSVLSYLLKLKKCIDAGHKDLCLALINRFCNTAIDYISYGHFQLLEAFKPEPHQLVALDRVTRQILTFESLYAQQSDVDLAQCKLHLEQIALSLEVRFEIEDEIISQPLH